MLLTGMSGVGKSTLVRELRERGYEVYGWVQRAARGRALGLASGGGGGVARAAATGAAVLRGLLGGTGRPAVRVQGSADPPEDVLVERLESRTAGAHGSTGAERAQILTDLRDVEPLLRRSADLVLEATESPAALTDAYWRRSNRLVRVARIV